MATQMIFPVNFRDPKNILWKLPLFERMKSKIQALCLLQLVQNLNFAL